MLSRSNAGSRCDAKVSEGRLYFGQFSYCEFSGASLPACPNTFLLFIPFLYTHFRLTHTRTHVCACIFGLSLSEFLVSAYKRTVFVPRQSACMSVRMCVCQLPSITLSA